MAAILAVMEQRDGALRKVSYETVTAARLLADTMGATVDALVVGAGTVAGVEQLAIYGADRVLTALRLLTASGQLDAIIKESRGMPQAEPLPDEDLDFLKELAST